VRWFWDFDGAVSRAYGAADEGGAEVDRPHTLLLDERLRCLAAWPFDESPQTHAERVLGLLAQLPRAGQPGPAPVLVVPRLFEPELCRALVRYYEERGGEESGFVRDVGGKTVTVVDHLYKKRRDQEVADPALQKSCLVRLRDRLVPEILKAYQFR